MKISILNGNPINQNSNLDQILSGLEERLKISGHTIKTFVLRDLNIRYCEGCFNCWLKTPGECSFSDDTQTIRGSFINSDFVLLASPIIIGFTSALLKKAIDKLIPLIHPYFEFTNSEVHHRKRYLKYPKLGVLLEYAENVDKEDFEIIRGIYMRNALNLKTSLSFTITTMKPIEEIEYEINNI